MSDTTRASALGKDDAREVVREISQIVTSKQASPLPAIGQSVQLAKKGTKAAQQKIAKVKEARAEKAKLSPRLLAKKAHRINQEIGKKGTDGAYRFKGANLTLKSKSSRNLSITRDGETKPAFEIKGGRVVTNNLSKSEKISIGKAYDKEVVKESEGLSK